MSGMEIVPKDIDKILCDWSIMYSHAFTENELGTLTAYIYNQLLSDNQIHTVPNDGLHCESRFCWCEPVAKVTQNAKTQFIHNKPTEEGH